MYESTHSRSPLYVPVILAGCLLVLLGGCVPKDTSLREALAQVELGRIQLGIAQAEASKAQAGTEAVRLQEENSTVRFLAFLAHESTMTAVIGDKDGPGWIWYPLIAIVATLAVAWVTGYRVRVVRK